MVGHFAQWREAHQDTVNVYAEDVLGEPAYRFWFLLRGEEPLLCMETTGRGWRRAGQHFDLWAEYRRTQRIWPVIVRVAGELLG